MLVYISGGKDHQSVYEDGERLTKPILKKRLKKYKIKVQSSANKETEVVIIPDEVKRPSDSTLALISEDTPIMKWLDFKEKYITVKKSGKTKNLQQEAKKLLPTYKENYTFAKGHKLTSYQQDRILLSFIKDLLSGKYAIIDKTDGLKKEGVIHIQSTAILSKDDGTEEKVMGYIYIVQWPSTGDWYIGNTLHEYS